MSLSLSAISVLFNIILVLLVHRPKEALCAPATVAGLGQLADDNNVARLRQMFLASQFDAIRSYHANNQGAAAQHHHYHPTASDQGLNQSQTLPFVSGVHVISLTSDQSPTGRDGDNSTGGDRRGQPQRAQLVLYQYSLPKSSGSLKSLSEAPPQMILANSSTATIDNRNSSTPTGADDDDADDAASLSKLMAHGDTKNHKNDARQSSLFPGIVSPNLGNSFGLGGGNTNPLVNGAFLRPAGVGAFGGMPNFHAFRLPSLQPQRQPQTPRQPKSSVIGNGGGAMALTNDNVVVVNVLSGNY